MKFGLTGVDVRPGVGFGDLDRSLRDRSNELSATLLVPLSFNAKSDLDVHLIGLICGEGTNSDMGGLLIGLICGGGGEFDIGRPSTTPSPLRWSSGID